jgi:hypothetical protein
LAWGAGLLPGLLSLLRLRLSLSLPGLLLRLLLLLGSLAWLRFRLRALFLPPHGVKNLLGAHVSILGEGLTVGGEGAAGLGQYVKNGLVCCDVPLLRVAAVAPGVVLQETMKRFLFPKSFDFL